MQVVVVVMRWLLQLVEVCRRVLWTRGRDGVVALYQWVCLIWPGGRRDGVRVGGRICCVWMVLMASRYR